MKHILRFNKFLNESKFTIINEAVFDISNDDFNEEDFDELTEFPNYFSTLKKHIDSNDYISFVGEVLNQMDNGEDFNAEILVRFIDISGTNKENYIKFINQFRISLEDWKEIYKGKNFATIHKEDIHETIPNLFNYIKAYAKDDKITYDEFKRLAVVIKKSDMCIDYLMLTQYAEKEKFNNELIIFLLGMQSYMLVLKNDTELAKKMNLMINEPVIKAGKAPTHSTGVKIKGKSGNVSKIQKFVIASTNTDNIDLSKQVGFLSFTTVDKKEHMLSTKDYKTISLLIIDVAKIIGYSTLAKASEYTSGKQRIIFTPPDNKIAYNTNYNSNGLISILINSLENTEVTKIDKDSINWEIKID